MNVISIYSLFLENEIKPSPDIGKKYTEKFKSSGSLKAKIHGIKPVVCNENTQFLDIFKHIQV